MRYFQNTSQKTYRNFGLILADGSESKYFIPKKWRCVELERVLEKHQKIIIYGCGYEGKIIKRLLELCGYDILCWCNSHKKMSGAYIEGKKVVSPDELLNVH
jgi:hypothetical protein